MSLTRNEIRRRLAAFAKQWQGAAREKSQAQVFWLRFYECFGIRAESATIYEQAVKKLDGAPGFIDSFIPGKLIVEHKSLGANLDAAFDQAADYFLALPEHERPRYIITSDFARIRLYDLQAGGGYHQCRLAELPRKADWFMFLVEGALADYTEESEADREAAYAIGQLHEGLLRAHFTGRDLEVLLTRLLFCLFADDTGILGDNGLFRRLLERTRADGADTGRVLAELFQVLNTPEGQRQAHLDEDLARFPYINGALFAEPTRIPAFDARLREQLIACARLDWSGISPAIFGAMFQGVLEAHKPDERRQASRRELGAHYTSERNILRVINPLFMDALRAELARVKNNRKLLQAFYERLATLTFLDPACGCGNFLVIAYRELRLLEMDAIEAMTELGLTNAGMGGLLDVSHLCRVRVSQFYGIEIDEAAAHIARVALWITDHQMNLEAAERFGTTRPSIPLSDSPHIVCANALALDWASLLPPAQCHYVLGNPPFVGKKEQNAAQKADMARVLAGIDGAGVLDYVSAWYVKATRYLHAAQAAGAAPPQAAFVSTNSITQGEQVAPLWGWLLAQGVRIRFAHRTFQWSNEGKGVAAVHCVIIGFGLDERADKTIYEYADIKAEPHAVPARHINPYLVDAPDVLLGKRNGPICAVPRMNYGSMANDDGHLLLDPAAAASLTAETPALRPYIRRYTGAQEFLNGDERYCIWLVDAPPQLLRSSAQLRRRLDAVRAYRAASNRAATRELAATPGLFGEIRQPDTSYLLVPKVSSEQRHYMPIGFMAAEVIANGSALIVPSATLYHFGVLQSSMHMAWMRAVCGRLESRYQYSASIVYNNFPWPSPTDAQRAAIEAAAHGVLDARAQFPGATLADLYDPLTMPPALVKAHAALDRAVDAAYGCRGGKDDPARVAFLFARYQQLAAPLAPASRARRRSPQLR
ncbi:MAG: N-6 DNA methylase [Rhodoferax sp.]